MQRQAVRNSEKSSRYHSDPSCEIAVVNMDVADVLVAQKQG